MMRSHDTQLKHGKYMNEDSSVGIELCDGYYLMYYYIQDWRPEGLTYRIKDGILILSFYSVEEFLFAIDGDNLVFICFNEVDEEGNMKLSPEGTARSYFFGKVLKYVGDETK